MLDQSVTADVTALVRAGFFEKDRVVEIVCEELYEPGEVDPDEVDAAVAAAIARLEVEKATWPDRTDCDRLAEAFAVMRADGILVLENAGVDQGDGYDVVVEEIESLPDTASVIGYCYYHGQDLPPAVAGGGLYLAFGPRIPADEPTRGADIGSRVAAALRHVGLPVEWDGTFADRIYIPDLDWKRR